MYIYDWGVEVDWLVTFVVFVMRGYNNFQLL
mgnify:CR=1 FL=1